MISRADVETLYSKFALDWGDARALTAAQVDLLCDDLNVGSSYGNRAYELSDLRQAFSWLLRRKQGRAGLPSVEKIVAAVEKQREWRRAGESRQSNRELSPSGSAPAADLPEPMSFECRVVHELVKAKLSDFSLSARFETDETFLRERAEAAIRKLEAIGVERDLIRFRYSPEHLAAPLGLIRRVAAEVVHGADSIAAQASDGYDPFADDEDAA